MRTGTTTLALAALTWAAATQAEDVKPFISEQVSPMEVIVAKDADGHETPAVVRRPPGRQIPRPAVVILHGGLSQMPLDGLKRLAAEEPLPALFLAEGYVVVQSTYRSRNDDPQRPETVRSAVAMIDRVKKLPGVDSKSVVAVGSSGGGTLALELAAETSVAAIGAHEPATVVFMGMLTKAVRTAGVIMQDPQRYWTPEIQQKTRERLKRLSCPVFVSHGDINALKKVNFEVFLPELMKSGKPVQIHVYPGMPHSVFFFHSPGRLEYLKRFFEDCNGMFKRYLATRPVPMERAALQLVPDVPRAIGPAPRVADLRDKPTVEVEGQPAPGETPVGGFPTRKIKMTVYLPVGCEQGAYELQILQKAGAPLVTLRGSTTFDEEQNLVLQLQTDFTGFEPGRYLLGIRKANSGWKYYPIRLSNQT